MLLVTFYKPGLTGSAFNEPQLITDDLRSAVDLAKLFEPLGWRDADHWSHSEKAFVFQMTLNKPCLDAGAKAVFIRYLKKWRGKMIWQEAWLDAKLEARYRKLARKSTKTGAK